ncbi:MAG: EscU/YscU/HrcU family type III secretion system export apparatus switch protein, partial [Bryobacteraceae bacterium]
MPDKGQRTEKPTPQRLQKARREGQFAVSRDFASGVQFVAFVALLGAFGGEWLASLKHLTQYMLDRAFRGEVNVLECQRFLRLAASRVFLPLAGAGAGLMLAGVGAHMAVTKLGVSTKKMAPDFSRLSPLRRLKELPRQNLPQFFQALVLLPIFSLAVYMVAKGNAPMLFRLPFQGVEAGVRAVAGSLQELLWKAAGILLVWG